MNILVLNAGSSSLKYQLIDTAKKIALAQGAVEKIGENTPAPITHKRLVIDGGADAAQKARDLAAELAANPPVIDDHGVAIQYVLNLIHAEEIEVEGVGHRVVHGGTFFSESVLVDDEVVKKIRLAAPMAPLHNYAAIDVMEFARKLLPDVTHVAVFDTAFHATIPPYAHRYALPKDFAEQFGMRKFGFHGTSHRYVALAAEKHFGKLPHNLLSMHIGNGASLCAIQDGKSIETTMGFTPLAGIMMGTRCGDIDPACVTYALENSAVTPNEMDRVMNRYAGLLGVSGVSNDFRAVQEQAEQGNADCQAALDMYVYSIVRHSGALVFAMGGMDCIAFTAGVGQNSSYLRERVCKALEPFGVVLDLTLNAERTDEVRNIAAPDSRVQVLVIPANEELMIARDVVSFIA